MSFSKVSVLRLPVFFISLLSLLSFLVLFFISPPVLPGQKAAGAGVKKEKLLPLLDANLDNLDPSVRKQILDGRKKVETTAKEPAVSDQKLGKVYGELAQLYHAYDLPDAAFVSYQNAVTLDPSNYTWSYSLGFLYQSEGHFNKAIPFYQKNKPDSKDLQQLYVWNIRIGECYHNLNQPAQAKPFFDTAYRINPEGPAVLARLGETAMAEKRYADAIKYLSEALKKQPGANKLHYTLAMAYRSSGDMTKARQHLAKRGMVGIQPPDPLKKELEKLATGYLAHFQAGKMAYVAKRYEEAAEEFRKAIKANPEKVAAHINLGVVLAKVNKYKEAISLFEKSLQMSPDNIVVRFNLGELYLFLDEPGKAVSHLEIVVKKDPKDAGAHFSLANALGKAKRFDEAIAHYRKAVKITPGFTSAWRKLSALYAVMGRHGDALKVMEEAYIAIPNNGVITHALARQLAASSDLKQRDGAKALKLAKQVFQAKQDYDFAMTVAFAYAQLNRCDKAVEWMETSIRLAKRTSQPVSVLQILERNLNWFKHNRPCRIPAKQKKKNRKKK